MLGIISISHHIYHYLWDRGRTFQLPPREKWLAKFYPHMAMPCPRGLAGPNEGSENVELIDLTGQDIYRGGVISQWKSSGGMLRSLYRRVLQVFL